LQDELDDDGDELTLYLIAELAKLKLLYLHCIEPRATGHLDVEPLPGQSLLPFRKAWPVSSAFFLSIVIHGCLCETYKRMSFLDGCRSRELVQLACRNNFLASFAQFELGQCYQSTCKGKTGMNMES
jgi:hypothetical protein